MPWLYSTVPQGGCLLKIRVLIEEKKMSRLIPDGTPELAIAVLPSHIGQGIGTQLMKQLLEAARLLHLTAFLTTAMPGAGEHLLLDLLPGDASPITGKGIELGPEVRDELIDRGTARIQQAQGLGLQAVWHTDGEREHLRFLYL
jgi:GNAT superfamily N-acetyltransferase